MSVAEFGVFVELERGVEGLVPARELSYEFASTTRPSS